MRVTVGGVLIVIAAAAAGYLAADRTYLVKIKDKAVGFTKQGASLVGLFKPGDKTKKEVYNPPAPFPDGTSAAGVAGSTGPVSSQQTSTATAVDIDALLKSVSQPSPAVKAPAKKAAVKKKPARKKKTTKSTKTVRKKTAAKQPKNLAAKPASAAKTGSKYDALIGTYVSMELITGQSVKGILQKKSGSVYTLDVPGLGPLEYPLENVANILPAE